MLTLWAADRQSQHQHQPYVSFRRILTPTRWTTSAKTVTALFADIKGSTALMAGLDLEEAREIIDPVLHRMIDGAHRFEPGLRSTLGFRDLPDALREVTQDRLSANVFLRSP